MFVQNGGQAPKTVTLYCYNKRVFGILLRATNG